jgi:hypothetical protein
MPNDSLYDTLASFSSRKSKSQSQIVQRAGGAMPNVQRLEPFV